MRGDGSGGRSRGDRGRWNWKGCRSAEGGVPCAPGDGPKTIDLLHPRVQIPRRFFSANALGEALMATHLKGVREPTGSPHPRSFISLSSLPQ